MTHHSPPGGEEGGRVTHLVTHPPLCLQAPGKPQPLAMSTRSSPHPAARLEPAKHLLREMDESEAGEEGTASRHTSVSRNGGLEVPQTGGVHMHPLISGPSGESGQPSWGETAGCFPLGDSAGTPRSMPAPPLPGSLPQVLRPLLKLQEYSRGGESGGSLPVWGCLSEPAALPSK